MNWGTKLFFGMATFIIFIMVMVFYMIGKSSSDALVDAQYYEKGIDYDKEYKAKQNVTAHNAEPKITILENQIIIGLEHSAYFKLKLMRPSDSKDDRFLKGNTATASNLIIIDTKGMHSGLWFLKLEWVSAQTNYSYDKNITL